MTEERKHYNEVVLPQFIKSYVKVGNLVLDVGKPNDGWGYRGLFPAVNYLTVDRNPIVAPDILDDMENTTLDEACADCVICHGVWEQCDNPFKLVEGLRKVLKVGGYGLFGIMSIGFPMIQDLDLCRFTPQGVEKLLKDFSIVNLSVIDRQGVPSYIYVIVKKEK